MNEIIVNNYNATIYTYICIALLCVLIVCYSEDKLFCLQNVTDNLVVLTVLYSFTL
jgi:hypothetical protein